MSTVGRCELLAASDGPMAVRFDDGSSVVLHLHTIHWPRCRRPLTVRLVSTAPIESPVEEVAGEPVEGALARLVRAHPYPEGLLVLGNPAEALGEAHMLHAEGVRLVAIDSPEHELCWDAALAKGLPLYGVRGELRLDCRRVSANEALAALAYGLFTCHEGLQGLQLDERRDGVDWRVLDPGPVHTRVVIREGFEAARFDGPAGAWHDRGDEASVRLVFSAATGRAWSQPRFIMPLPPGTPRP